MIFVSDLPTRFWSDAAEYTTQILICTPPRLNEYQTSPLVVITEKSPGLRDVVAFGASSTARRDPKQSTLQKRARQLKQRRLHFDSQFGNVASIGSSAKLTPRKECDVCLRSRGLKEARTFQAAQTYREFHVRSYRVHVGPKELLEIPSEPDAAWWTATELEELVALIANAT
ncbi:unnamed protein product [Phytophthora fragariaefolia]|uniref:Unnamed protein product n=1 Tax=Phytophthora fragariaefolia TaxID=1490495 RepID=A0A9W6TJJ5_9STRA|nr:unnamed protein product [Phytophthora fragariaefolia]